MGKHYNKKIQSIISKYYKNLHSNELKKNLKNGLTSRFIQNQKVNEKETNNLN